MVHMCIKLQYYQEVDWMFTGLDESYHFLFNLCVTHLSSGHRSWYLVTGFRMAVVVVTLPVVYKRMHLPKLQSHGLRLNRNKECLTRRICLNFWNAIFCASSHNTDTVTPEVVELYQPFWVWIYSFGWPLRERRLFLTQYLEDPCFCLIYCANIFWMTDSQIINIPVTKHSPHLLKTDVSAHHRHFSCTTCILPWTRMSSIYHTQNSIHTTWNIRYSTLVVCRCRLNNER